MGILKKIKKVVKKAAKPAALIGAAYLASKGLGKKYNTSSVSADSGRGSNLRNILKSAMPGNLSKSAGPYKDAVGKGMNRKNWSNWYDDSAPDGSGNYVTPRSRSKGYSRDGATGLDDAYAAKDGGRATYKSGGAAKRGVSPILLKGKK